MEKAPKLYFVGLVGAIAQDKNGNNYITALCHNGNVDEDGCVVEPLIGQMVVNSAISPMIYAHIMKAVSDKDTADKIGDKETTMFAVPPAPTRGLVSRLAMDEFYIVDANGVRVQKDGEDRVGKFVTVAVLGSTKDEVAAATVAAYEDRFAYYEEKGLFVDAEANAKPNIKTMIDTE